MNTATSEAPEARRSESGESRPPHRLLVGTQHPEHGGGVLTLLRAFTHWARQQPDLSAAVAYSPLRHLDPVNARLLAPLSRGRKRTEQWEGLPAHCVGRQFSRIEAWHCTGNQGLWRSVLGAYDIYQVVCGYALTGLPQALAGKPYVLWVATSMDGDKRARVAEANWLRRFAHRVQLRELLRQERLVLEKAAWVMALSPHTQAELLERGAVAERTSVVRCPIDTARFLPVAAPPAQPTVIWAGRHNDPRKRTLLLLRAFARLWPKLPQARLLLIGQGDQAELRRAAAELHIEQGVEFAGYQPLACLPELFRRGSVFAIPSEQEGLCIGGLEAMASGLPVVSTRCGGPETFVLPNRTGLLVDIDDEAGMAEALRLLLTNEALRRELGAGARRLVEEEYGLEVFARQMRRIYETVWPKRFAPARAT